MTLSENFTALLWGLVGLIATTAMAGAAVIRVPEDSSLQAAFDAAQTGDIIDIAPGTYASPANGFQILGARDFVVRARVRRTANLDGNNSNQVMRLRDAGSVLFDGLVFRNGRSTANGFSGGVTIINSQATFTDSLFENNTAVPTNTGGGGLFMYNGSIVHVVDSRFEGNTATNEGGGMRVGDDTEAYVHNTEFISNRTNLPNHRNTATGGAIHITNADMWITDSRFENNESGCNAGAIVVLGSPWLEPVNIPKAELFIANTTFESNKVEPHPTVTCGFNPTGGAVHGENQSRIKIHHSRFFGNSATAGGALSQFRSEMEVYDSVFRGNFSVGTGTESFGGTLQSNSNDTDTAANDDLGVNRPSARLTVRDSLFQGRDGGGPPARRGGCIFAEGDTARSYGRFGVQEIGTPATNRAVLDFARTVFYDCDVEEDPAGADTGDGGAMELSHVDLTLTDSLLFDNDALGGGAGFPSGGAIRLLFESNATINGTTFANNSSATQSGALHIAGSSITIDDSRFLDNEVTAGSSGSAIYSRPLPAAIGFGTNMRASGQVSNSVFSNNSSINLREFADNSTEPINNIRYVNNQFFTSPFNSNIFANNLAGNATAAELNSLVVNRGGAANTDKGSGNSALSSEPSLGMLLAVPTELLLAGAVGDTSQPEAFAAWAWSGNNGTLNGGTVGETGVVSVGDGGHTLNVDGNQSTDTVSSGPNLGTSTFSASPISISSGESSNLSWNFSGGDFLRTFIDRGVTHSQAASGSVQLFPNATTEFRLHGVTQQGGISGVATIFVDEPGSDQIFVDGFESGNTSAWSLTIP